MPIAALALLRGAGEQASVIGEVATGAGVQYRRMSLRFAVLISGRGSNMLALERATRDGASTARIVAVISDRADAAGLAAARTLGLEASVLETARRRGSRGL